MVRLIKHMIPWWMLVLGLFTATAVVWQASRWAYSVELKSLLATGEERLTLYSGTLRGALSRYAYLPYVLARNGALQQLIESGGGPDRVNRYLEDLNREAGSDALYVMNAAGLTIASYAWNGTGPIKAEGPQKNLRSVTMLWQNVEHFTIDKKFVKTGTVADLAGMKGESMALGKKNSGTLGSNLVLLSNLGIAAEKDYNLVYVGC